MPFSHIPMRIEHQCCFNANEVGNLWRMVVSEGNLHSSRGILSQGYHCCLNANILLGVCGGWWPLRVTYKVKCGYSTSGRPLHAWSSALILLGLPEALGIEAVGNKLISSYVNIIGGVQVSVNFSLSWSHFPPLKPHYISGTMQCIFTNVPSFDKDA